MLWSLAFERIGVVVGDLYFVDPAIDQGADGAERGVRLELRHFERDSLKGDVYSATPIRIDRPIWRIDLLETADSAPGSLNRAHHHPRFHGWDPGPRVFVEELSADPVTWVQKRFADISSVLEEAGVPADDVGPTDVEALQRAAPEISRNVELQLAEVAAGRAGLPPAERGGFVRQSWL